MIVSEANALVEEFKEQVDAPRQNALPRKVGQTPPSEGWYKVNVDGVVFKESGSCGIGIVIRNKRGQIMGAMSKKMNFTTGSFGSGSKGF